MSVWSTAFCSLHSAFCDTQQKTEQELSLEQLLLKRDIHQDECVEFCIFVMQYILYTAVQFLLFNHGY